MAASLEPILRADTGHARLAPKLARPPRLLLALRGLRDVCGQERLAAASAAGVLALVRREADLLGVLGEVVGHGVGVENRQAQDPDRTIQLRVVFHLREGDLAHLLRRPRLLLLLLVVAEELLQRVHMRAG